MSRENWTLERMADIAGMPRSAFVAVFIQATGTTPAQYLSDCRLMLAASVDAARGQAGEIDCGGAGVRDAGFVVEGVSTEDGGIAEGVAGADE